MIYHTQREHAKVKTWSTTLNVNMLRLKHMIYHSQREHAKVKTHDLPH